MAKSIPKFWRHRPRKFIYVFTALVLILAAILIYKKSTQDHNKTNFDHARSAVSTLYSDLKQKLPPKSSKNNSECTTFYKGIKGYSDLTCSTAALFVYDVSDKNTPSKLYNTAQKIIQSHKDLLQPAEPLKTASFSDSSKTTSVLDAYKSSGLECIVNYILKDPKDLPAKIRANTNSTNKEFDITIGCSGPARTAYFPLDNKHR